MLTQGRGSCPPAKCECQHFEEGHHLGHVPQGEKDLRFQNFLRIFLQDDPPPPEDDENKEKRTDDISTWDADFLKVDSPLGSTFKHLC